MSSVATVSYGSVRVRSGSWGRNGAGRVTSPIVLGSKLHLPKRSPTPTCTPHLQRRSMCLCELRGLHYDRLRRVQQRSLYGKRYSDNRRWGRLLRKTWRGEEPANPERVGVADRDQHRLSWSNRPIRNHRIFSASLTRHCHFQKNHEPDLLDCQARREPRQLRRSACTPTSPAPTWK